jgi:hypothetical protein
MRHLSLAIRPCGKDASHGSEVPIPIRALHRHHAPKKGIARVRKLLVPAAGIGHAFIHVASFGLDDILILIVVGVFLLWRSN